MSGGSGVFVTLDATGGGVFTNGGLGTDTFVSIENVFGSNTNDELTGNGFDNLFRGRSGDDTLDGAGGSDTADYSEAGSGVTVNLGLAGPQLIGAGEGSDTLISIENVIGSAQGDTLTGNGSVNIIDGGLGNDTMAGLGGNDTYFDNLGDTISEALNAGYDTVNSTRTSYTLGANLERVNFIGSGNFVGTGNALSNRFQAGSGDDRIVDILGGADIFSGGAGTDTVDFRTSATGAILDFTTNIHGGAAAGDSYSSIEKFLGSNTDTDTMTAGGVGRVIYAGFGGDDTLTGGIKNDQLLGGAGNDILSGGADRDSLDGGTGNDTMTGGTQGDVFVFVDAAFGQDTITDYQDGIDSFKIFSAVATSLADFTVTNNGTASVTLTLTSAPANFITINGAAPITIAADDFVFY
jgi:Ca2+-binding RTX toxin-like protein